MICDGQEIYTPQQMYLVQGINPSPSPFTSRFGVNLHRRPILSWVLNLLGHFTRQHQPCGFLSCTLELTQISVPIHISSRYFRVLSIARLESHPKLASNNDYHLLSI